MERRAPLEGWVQWPVYWSAVWVGVLAALCVGILFGLAATALGAHELSMRIVKWSSFGVGALIFSVFGAFISFVVGAWLATKVAGIRRAETAILHGSIVWLVAVPLVVLFAALGGGSVLGPWYGGLAGTPSWVSATPATDPNTAAALRNGALGAITALLISLIGSVVGSWWASGEPMTYERVVSRAREIR